MRWLGQLGVVDAWRIHHYDEHVYTGPHPRRNRLDYILLSEDFCSALYGDSKYFTPKGAGEHLAHEVTLRSMSQPQGYGYWRFPAYLLEYSDIVNAIRGEAQQVLEDLQVASNPGMVWEKWKQSMRRQLQALQRKLCYQNGGAIMTAQAVLDQASAQYRAERDPFAQARFSAALDNYRECVSRSRCYNQDSAFDFHVRNTETSSRYFFRPLDLSLRRVSIEEVRTPEGDISRNPADISTGFRTHWGSIMGDAVSHEGQPSPNANTNRQRLLESIDKSLSLDYQALLNAPISGDDLANALRHMKANSAPGMDGLTAGFYQVAPDVFGECLRIVFHYQLTRGELLPSQRKSAVCLLHKKGSRADPGNFRPISLMGVDVKALSKVLAYRLQLFLPQLIHADQKAFVKGRSLHHHVRFMVDLQDLVTTRGEEAYAMFLDFEKAYDRVNWDYMFQVLSRMGCGGIFSEWVALLYTGPQAHLLLNGHVQLPIFPTQGVKQGDPLSALLFLMVIEPLGNLLRQHEEYGICLTDDHTATSVFFADDLTLLARSIPDIQAQLDLVQVYCDGSGARINLAKSVPLPLNRRTDPSNLHWVRVLQRGETVKFLGILFGQDPVADAIVEFLDRRFYEGFFQWFRRARTLRGRLLVAQTMVLSRVWHYSVHVPITSSVVKQWQSTLNRFVLARRYERNATHIQLIPKEFLYQSRSDGGLSVPSIAASLKRQQLNMLLQLIAVSALPRRNWETPGLVLLSLVLPTWGPWRPLDFLTISPMRHGALLRWEVLSPWWRHTWRLWYLIQWKVTWRDIAPLARLGYVLDQPIWFHAAASFQFELATRITNSGSQRRSLCMVAEPQRSFRRHIATTFQLRCLCDFLTAEGAWPGVEAFARGHIDYRLLSVPAYRQYQWLRRLHFEATQVFQRLRELCGNAPLPPPGVAWECPPSPYVGVRFGGRVYVVPSVPRSQLLLLTWQAQTPTKPHPIQLHDVRATLADIKAFVQQSKHIRSFMLPVYEDLQFRLAFRLLPVRSRFSFLRGAHPDIIYCVHSECHAEETERHLFFECILPAQLWTILFRDWSDFFTSTPAWVDIALGRPPTLAPAWRDHAAVVRDLWQIIRCIALHLLWSMRNDTLFRKRPPLTLMPALKIVYTTFSAHVRACKRTACPRAASIAPVCADPTSLLPLVGFIYASERAAVCRALPVARDRSFDVSVQPVLHRPT